MEKYLFAGVSLQNRRATNMDSLLIKPSRINKEDSLLAVVCDGVGSLNDGGYASGMAARMLGDWFEKLKFIEDIGTGLKDFISELNLNLIEQAEQKTKDTASTLSALILIKNKYIIVHLGDSRIYSYTNNCLTLLTKDDISEEGKLTAYIGRNRQIYPQYYDGDAEGKTFLLCSDGLYKRMDEYYLSNLMESMGNTKEDLQNVIELLPQHVIDRGEKDNITIALIKGMF